jgi:DNA-binding LytR/AlgR family response regulator
MQADAVQASLDTRDAEPAPSPAEGSLGVVVGEREHRLYVLKAARVDCIESHGNYVKFRCGGAEYISRDSIKRLAGVLAGDGFIRIGRCLMIDEILRVLPRTQGRSRDKGALRLAPRELSGQ